MGRVLLLGLVIGLWWLPPVNAADHSAVAPAQLPPRDATLRAVEATSVLRGRVVGADTGAPLRDTPVTLSPLTSGASQSIRTDVNGFFEFTGLMAGEYRLRVIIGPSSARYLPLTDSGTPHTTAPIVRLRDGQVLEGLEIRLQRAAAIAGRVLDDFGDPIALATVRVVQTLSGGRQAARVSARPIVTDDHGRFRIFGLAPGSYQVSAEPPTVGGVTEDTQTRLLTTYYPSTADAAESTIVKLGIGEEALDVDLRLVRSGVFTIRGTVVDSRGVPSPEHIVTIMRRRADGGFLRADASVEPDGAFLLRSVVAGEYFLAARPKLNAPNLGPSGEFAVLPLSVHQHLHGIVLSTRKWASVSGRVLLESAAAESYPAGLRVTAVEPDGRPAANLLPASALVAADGTFTLHNVPDGVLLRVLVARGWWLKSVTVGGQDVTDRPTDYRTGEQRVQIVLTRQGATVTGSATGADGKPAPSSVVLLFGAEPEQWTARASTTRTAPVQTDGTFTIPVVRAGRYRVVALRNEDLSLQDASTEYFEMLAKLAEAVTIVDGQPSRIALKVSRLPD